MVKSHRRNLTLLLAAGTGFISLLDLSEARCGFGPAGVMIGMKFWGFVD